MSPNPNPPARGIFLSEKDTPSFKYIIKKNCIAILLLLGALVSRSQPNLEGDVPSTYSAAKGTLSISDRHFRIGEQSLKWDWIGGDTLIIDLNATEEASLTTGRKIYDWEYNHFEMWVHNETAGEDTFDVEFINKQGVDQFRFNFNVNYEGWRRLLRSYRFDMISRSYPWDENWNVDKIYLAAPKVGMGTVFLDDIRYIRTKDMKYSDRQMPDLYRLARYKDNYIDDFHYRLDSINSKVPVGTPTDNELQGLASVRTKILEYGASTAPSAEDLASANAAYAAYNIIIKDGVIKGKDITKPLEISGMFVTFTRSFIHSNNTESRDKAVNLLRLMLDCGVAGGSSRWFAGGAAGYDDMDFFAGLIEAYGFIPASLRYPVSDFLKWSTDVNLGWIQDPNGLFNTDNFYVLYNAYLGAILYNPDDAVAVKDLKCLKNYLEKFLQVQKGNTDGMKPDGTAFHHFAHYNAYMYAYNTIMSVIMPALENTPFQISSAAYYNLRKVVYSQYVTSNINQYANSLTGRHPFDSRMVFFERHFAALANIGGDVLDIPFDPIVAGMRAHIWGVSSEFPGATAESFPSGFWQMNYSPLAMFRRQKWAATIKGINNYFWGTEIYGKENRYGRYQSYGAVEVISTGGLAGSGISEKGWDWNKVPGTTTIVLPFNELSPPASIPKILEKNTLNFSGGAKFGTPGPNAPSDIILADLHGEYGMFGLNFRQPSISGTSHNPSFVFRKSYFCFGDKIVCLGSNINNNDGANKTITTLFQGSLPSTGTPTVVDGSAKTGISQSEDLSETNAHWLIDAYKTGYYVLPGNTIHVERQSQTSPDQSGSGATTTANFANAFIDHGNAPSSAEYAYVIAPNTTESDMASFAAGMQSPSTRAFDILQQDTAAHIIRENANGVTGFSLFLPNDNLVSNDILKANDVPCVTMMQINADTLRISLVNPDLNLVNNVSTAVPITLTLYGKWSKIPDIPSRYANVISAEPTQTIVQFNPADGLPAEIALIKSNEVILPIELLSFSGYPDLPGNRNVLNLKVENDNETMAYYLERQNPDNGAWNTIDSYTFAATTGQQQFTFYDKNIDAPAYLYRVKWQESSGLWQYSNIVLLKNKQQNAITIAPNPAKNEFFIRLKQQPRGLVNWILADASGKAVKHGRLNSASEKISVQGLASGAYFLRLSTGETMGISVIK